MVCQFIFLPALPLGPYGFKESFVWGSCCDNTKNSDNLVFSNRNRFFESVELNAKLYGRRSSQLKT